jgi:ubiquinone biosynthesis UbiH/UbiF/VisC/COQ6 family hydroxylase
MAKPSYKKSASKKASAHDVIIIGGGPAGLAFAASLKDLGLRIAVVEKSPVSVLADPPEDGREIALTHTSVAIMGKLGMLRRIPEKDLSPIRTARVLDGTSPYELSFDSESVGREALGFLVPNHRIRKAAFEIVRGQKGLEIVAGAEVSAVAAEECQSIVTLADGRVLTAPLTVAADGRFSCSRRMMGIPVSMRDFGRSVIVCRMEHEKPHRQTAYECFHYERTLAMLPLHGRTSSAVITLSSKDAPALLALPEDDFNADITARFGDHLGAMKLAGRRHAYPLVATYADRFTAERFAVIGDAAVGMHPVTAHGFNFGLRGQHTLAEEIKAAAARGGDIADPALLRRYQSAHRRATWLMYQGTNATAMLYTDDRLPARVLRDAALRIGNRLPPVRWAVLARLMEAGGLPHSRPPLLRA